MVHGRADRVLRADGVLEPRPMTARSAGAFGAGCVLLAAAFHSWTPLFALWLPLGLLMQSGQRLLVEGRFLRRDGFRPVEVDLSTAEIVHRGRRWWIELCFLGSSFEIVDAYGSRLHLPSWLWPDNVRAAVAGMIGPERSPAESHS